MITRHRLISAGKRRTDAVVNIPLNPPCKGGPRRALPSGHPKVWWKEFALNLLRGRGCGCPLCPCVLRTAGTRFTALRALAACCPPGLAPEPVLFAAANPEVLSPKGTHGFAPCAWRRWASPTAPKQCCCARRELRLAARVLTPVVGVMKRNFGTVGASAFAFIFGFLPQIAVQIRKSKYNSDRKSKYSS